MSFFKRLEKALRPLGGVIKGAVSALPGGQAVLMAREALISIRKVNQGVTPSNVVLPGRGALTANPMMGGLGQQLGLDSSIFSRQTMALTGAVRTPTQLRTRGQRQQNMSLLPSIIRGGAAIARRGGTFAGAAATAAILYDQFGNPVARKRRRSKGITATQLKAFTRVTAILNKYCKTPPPRRPAKRSTKCR